MEISTPAQWCVCRKCPSMLVYLCVMCGGLVLGWVGGGEVVSSFISYLFVFLNNKSFHLWVLKVADQLQFSEHMRLPGSTTWGRASPPHTAMVTSVKMGITRKSKVPDPSCRWWSCLSYRMVGTVGGMNRCVKHAHQGCGKPSRISRCAGPGCWRPRAGREGELEGPCSTALKVRGPGGGER